jgi:hypothetical protein
MEQQEQNHLNRLRGLRNEPETVDGASPQPPDHDDNIDIALDAQSVESHGLVFRSKPPSAPFSHPSLVFRHSTVARPSSQHVQDFISIRYSSRSQSEERTTRATCHRGRPASSRRRSRSPTAATRPSFYRDRSQGGATSRHDFTVAVDHTTESAAVCNADEIVVRHLRLDKLRKEKNDYVICITCWLKDLPCDHQLLCSECQVSGSPCAYIACPLNECALDRKCPCYHGNKAIPQDTPPRKIGSCMHLLALLSLDRLPLDSYDMSEIHFRLPSPSSAQQTYLQLEQEIEDIIQQGNYIDDLGARKLLRESDKVAHMGLRRLKAIARLIARLIQEKK